MFREPILSGGVRPDFIGTLADGSTVVVQVLRRSATPNDVVRLAGEANLARIHAQRQAPVSSPRPARRGATNPRRRSSRDVEMLLLAPTFSSDARRTAETLGAVLLAVPALSLGAPEPPPANATTRVHLTTRRSWATVSELILRRQFPTIRALAQASHGSYAWTHALVSYLEALGVVRRDRNSIVLSDTQRLLDYVGMERPLRQLRALELPTAAGLAPRDLLDSLREVFPEWGQSFVCGLSAASIHGSSLQFPNLVQVYANVPRATRNALAHSVHMGGWLQRTNDLSARRRPRNPSQEQPSRLELYTADREITDGAVSLSGVPVVSVRQTLLDCAGLGSAGHRAVIELVNKHGNAT